MAVEKHQQQKRRRIRRGSSQWTVSREEKKSDDEFTATALWHWPLNQSPTKKSATPRLPEIKMSDCQSRWCHRLHLSPISADSCFNQGAWVSLRHCDRDTHPLTSLLILRPSLPQCQEEPCRQEARKLNSFSTKRSRAWARSYWQEFDPIDWWNYVKGNCELPLSGANLVTFISCISHRKWSVCKVCMCTQGPSAGFMWLFIYSEWSSTPLFFLYIFLSVCLFFIYFFFFKKPCVQAQHEEWVILSDALRVERPSLWAVQPCLTRKREERACVLACVSVPCVCVRVYGGETLFLDVTVQPSQPLLSNTSLLFRGFHRRPAIRKTRSPNRRPAGAGRRSPTHIRGSWRLIVKG